jgi:hypothetical protein
MVSPTLLSPPLSGPTNFGPSGDLSSVLSWPSSPMSCRTPGLSLIRTPSIHSAVMTRVVLYSGYTFGT